jgi:futalosine hydrolase
MITDICGMYILLVAATTLEIQPTARFLQEAGFRLGAHEAGILITGVGGLATTHSLMRSFAERRPDLVIQAGIAGAFKAIGEVLTVKEEVLDIGVWEDGRFKTLFDLGLAEKDALPFSEGMLVNPHRQWLDLAGFPQVRGYSVNEISTDRRRIDHLQQNVLSAVETMEGGALHYTCLQEQIPFLQLRSVSNLVGERDKTKWDIPTAVRQLNEALTGLLHKLAALKTLE